MPGTQHYTLFQLGKETVAGTSVAATRIFYPDGTGMFDIDPMHSFHEDSNRGVRTPVSFATQKGIAVTIPFRSAPETGLAFDELPYVLSQLAGGVTGSGATAAKIWNHTPSQTAANSQESYTIEAGDDTQSWDFEYAQASRFRLSATWDGLTQYEVDWFARQDTKATRTTLTANNGVKIPGKFWKIRHATTQAGLNAASDQTNLLLDWDLDVTTGLVPRFYQDGNDYFGQSVEAADIDFTLTFHVESTAFAVSQYYDKWRAETVDFIRLRANGAALGSTTYATQIDMGVLYTNVKPISAEQDGVNIYEVTARAAYDATWANSISFHTIASISSL